MNEKSTYGQLNEIKKTMHEQNKNIKKRER